MVSFHRLTIRQKRIGAVFVREERNVLKQLSAADVGHVGSTSVPSLITKGDLDIQVRVSKEQFEAAKRRLAQLYKCNIGNKPTSTDVSFKGERRGIPLGIQLTVRGSREDEFSVQRDILLKSEIYRKKYSELKKRFDGKSMRECRKAKARFFAKMKRL